LVLAKVFIIIHEFHGDTSLETKLHGRSFGSFQDFCRRYDFVTDAASAQLGFGINIGSTFTDLAYLY